MKKKTFDIVTGIFATFFLATSVILIFIKIVTGDVINFFNTDGLALLGCILALIERWINASKIINTLLNPLLLRGRLVNYRLDIKFELCGIIQIKEIINELEKDLVQNLSFDKLQRKPNCELSEVKWRISYQNIGCTVECISMNGEITLKIYGFGKYGDMSKRNKDTLCFADVITLLGNNFCASPHIQNRLKFEKFESYIYLSGSEIKIKNLFDEDIPEMERFSAKVSKEFIKESEITINNDEVKWSTVDSRMIIPGYHELTNILCKIE